jgi:hypothetical protein
VISFTPRRLLPTGKEPWYPLCTRLSGPQSRSGRCAEEKYFTSAGIRTPSVQLVALPTELSRLRLLNCYILNSSLHYPFPIFYFYFYVFHSIVIFRLPSSISFTLNGLKYVLFNSCIDTLPISMYILYLNRYILTVCLR